MSKLFGACFVWVLGLAFNNSIISIFSVVLVLGMTASLNIRNAHVMVPLYSYWVIVFYIISYKTKWPALWRLCDGPCYLITYIIDPLSCYFYQPMCSTLHLFWQILYFEILFCAMILMCVRVSCLHITHFILRKFCIWKTHRPNNQFWTKICVYEIVSKTDCSKPTFAIDERTIYAIKYIDDFQTQIRC